MKNFTLIVAMSFAATFTFSQTSFTRIIDSPEKQVVELLVKDSLLSPPSNLVGEFIPPDNAYLTWDPPSVTPGVWLGYDDGTNADGIGGPGSFLAAIRWDAADLVPYDGYALTKINFFPRNDGGSGTASFILKIWTGANLIYEQALASVIFDEWNEVTLDTPHMVDASDELWVGYSVEIPVGDYPAGVDPGPAVTGYGDLISFDGTTWASLSAEYGLDHNWNLKAYVISPYDGVNFVEPVAITQLPIINEGGKPVLGKLRPGTNKVMDAGKGFICFNVYKDGQYYDNTTDMNYTDSGLEPGTYLYDVTALYDEGESESAGEVELEIPTGPSGIVVDPTSITQAVPIGGVATTTLDITNLGDSDLTFDISIEYASTDGPDVIVDPEEYAIVLAERRKREGHLLTLANSPAGGVSIYQTDDEIIRYDDGVNNDGIGMSGGTFQAAAYWPAETMGAYAGMQLNQVELYINDVPDNCVLKIYDAGTTTVPGALLHEQTITVSEASWGIYDLDTPVPISGDDLWVGYEVTLAGPSYPCGCDAGPAVSGFGDMISLDGVNFEPMLGFGLDYNWNLVGYLIDGGPQPINDVGVQSILAPVSGEDLTANEPITIKIKNYGLNSQSNIPYEVSWEGGSYSGTFAGMLASGADAEVTLPVTADLSTYGEYDFEACTQLVGDEIVSNNCSVAIINNIEPSLCLYGLYTTGCLYGDGLITWDLAGINVPLIECGNGDPNDWYHDFTDLIHEFEAGNTYTLTVQAGYTDTYLDVWIDFNDDFYLDDNELILNDASLPLATTNYTFDITIPASAADGQHVMRYRTNWTAPVTESCETLSYGNMCDFTAQIGGGGPQWLLVDPMMGMVAPYGTETITLGFNATSLPVGSYYADLIITNNSPTAPVIVVPVQMIPGYPPEPTIVVYPEMLEEMHDNPPQITTQIITVTNIGEETLEFDVEVYTNDPGPDVVIDPEVYAAAFAARQAEEGHSIISERAPGATAGEIQYSDDPFDLQFEYPCAVATGEAGIETDGNYIYTTLWNGTDFVKYEMDGTYVETFSCGTAAALRDLAYDGTYFYGGAAATTVFEMDFDAQTLVSTIAAPVACRAIAYDDGEDGFWANNWSDSPTLFDRGGATLNSFAIDGDESFYGFAWMDNDQGTGLWGYSQEVGTSQNMLYLYDVSSGTILSEFDMLTILTLPVAGTNIGGGLYMHPDIVQGYWTLGGIVQNICLWGVQMGTSFLVPLDNDVSMISIVEPTSGVELTNAEPITVKVKNNGLNSQTDIPIEVTWDNGSWSGMVPGTLAYSKDTEFTLPVTANLYAYNEFMFEACTMLSGDENPGNDCKTKTVTNIEPSLCIDDLYTSGCSFGDGLVSWDFANVNVPLIQCANGDPYDWYHDFRDMVHGFEAGMTYILTVQVGYADTYFDVWIDFNDDLYCDNNELILNDAYGATTGTNYTFAVIIPAGATDGQHVMRFRTNWQATVTESCEILAYGNMCDFTAQVGGSEPWLSIDMTSGSLEQNESIDIMVIFNSQNLYPGIYTGGLVFTSNDPNNPVIDVPVTLFPSGPPPLVFVNPDEFYFAMEPGTQETQVMEIHNLGGGTLDYYLSIVYEFAANKDSFPQERPDNFDASNCEVVPGSYAGPVQYSDDPFDLQFEYACADATGEAGIETDGTYIYTTLWNGNQFVKYDLFGNYIETFACGSAAALRDLAYDGVYFYGGAAATTIFEMDFTNKVLISTFTSPVATRAIAYDPIEDGFWSNNWSDSPTLWDRSGSTLNSFNINGDESFYGFAFMHNDEGTGLWGYSQKVGTSQNMLYLYDVSNGTLLDEFDMLSILTLPIPGTDIGGGLYMHENIVPGTWTLGGLVQNVCLWGVEMGTAEGPVLWLSVYPTSGSIASGEMDEIDVTAFAEEQPNWWFYEAVILIASNDPNIPLLEIPVFMDFIIIPPPPQIHINPSQFYFELLPNQQQTTGMAISNVGISTLNFWIDIVFQQDLKETVQWLTCEPTSGSVQYYSPVVADVTVNTEGFNKDTTCYYATINISSNDPDTPLREVPVTLGLITSIDEEYEKAYIMMYPNPAEDKINISSNFELNKVSLTNGLGLIVIKQQVSGKVVQLNTSDLQKGIYFVKVNSVVGESTHKLVIQ